MRFFGKLKTNSYIHADWRIHNRLVGFLDGVCFRLVKQEYVSGELSTEEIDKFKARQDQAVLLESMSVSPLKPEPIPVEPPERKRLKR